MSTPLEIVVGAPTIIDETEKLIATLTTWHPRVDVYVDPQLDPLALNTKWLVYAVDGTVRTLLAEGTFTGDGVNPIGLTESQRVLFGVEGGGTTIELRATVGPLPALPTNLPLVAAIVGWDPNFASTPNADENSQTNTLGDAYAQIGLVPTWHPSVDVLVDATASPEAVGTSTFAVAARITGLADAIVSAQLLNDLKETVIQNAAGGCEQWVLLAKTSDGSPTVSTSILAYNREGGDAAGGGGGIQAQIQDVPIPGTFTTIDFSGAGIDAYDNGGGQLNVVVPATIVKDEGGSLGEFLALNFVGAGVTAANAGGGVASVTIPGASGAVIIGPNVVAPPTAVGDRTLVGGSQATGNGIDGVSLGTQASCDGSEGVAIGPHTKCGAGSQCIAIGASVNNAGAAWITSGTADYATCVGYASQVAISGSYSIGLGVGHSGNLFTSFAAQKVIALLAFLQTFSGVREHVAASLAPDDTRYIASANLPNGVYTLRISGTIISADNNADRKAFIWSVLFENVAGVLTIIQQGVQEILSNGAPVAAWTMTADVAAAPARIRIQSDTQGAFASRYSYIELLPAYA